MNGVSFIACCRVKLGGAESVGSLEGSDSQVMILFVLERFCI